MGTHLVNSIGWRDGLGDVPDCVVSSPVLRLVVGCAYVCADRTGAACVCKQRQLQQQGSAVAAGAAGGAGEEGSQHHEQPCRGLCLFRHCRRPRHRHHPLPLLLPRHRRKLCPLRLCPLCLMFLLMFHPHPDPDAHPHASTVPSPPSPPPPISHPHPTPTSPT